MSMWGKVSAASPDLPLAASQTLLAVGTHWTGRAQQRQDPGAASVETRQTAFTVAVIVLSAKMAKADGRVTG